MQLYYLLVVVVSDVSDVKVMSLIHCCCNICCKLTTQIFLLLHQ